MSTALLPALSPDLRTALRAAASSTWVVTGAGSPDTEPVGFTAISVVSVSLDPPLVSFNISKTSSSLVTLGRTRRAALHLLADDQYEIAIRFSTHRERRFALDGTWDWDHGLPQVHGTALRLVTRVIDLVDAGDSFLAIARVEHSRSDATAAPLIHHQGRFVPLSLIGA